MQPFLPCNQGLFATMRWFFAIPVPWHWQGVPAMAVVSCMEVCRLKGRCRPGLVAAGVFGHVAFCGYGWPGATARRQWHRAGQCLHSGGPAVAWLLRLLYWPARRPFLHCRTARFGLPNGRCCGPMPKTSASGWLRGFWLRLGLCPAAVAASAPFACEIGVAGGCGQQALHGIAAIVKYVAVCLQVCNKISIFAIMTYNWAA